MRRDQRLVLLGSGLLVVGLLASCQAAQSSGPKHQTTKTVTVKKVSSSVTTPTRPQLPFKQLVAKTLGPIKGQSAVAIQTTTGQTYYWHNRQQKAASVIKLFILATVYQQVVDKTLRLDTTYTLKARDKVGGTGNLQAQAVGTPVTYRALVKAMMTVSDNTATNILIRAVGGRTVVNREIARLGATKTRLNRLMMDQTALAAGRDNVTSVGDLSRVLMRLWHHRLISPAADTAMLNLMAANTNHQKLPRLVSSQLKVYNKTGEFDTYGVENDAAILAKGRRAIVVVALSQGGTLAQQLPAMNQLGHQVTTTYFHKE
ncbi:serine hydrolase [Lactiplantibacillus daowaiensis]|uniref:Serine hydrolase n=1 Tax=Lactiplantibacillus daowaiensis TaxID=2559918 RepID=A0ABW1S1W6_9LACO|nr:serine hydrolase [Lactiplantibacillus daowaiensis]